MIAWLWRMRLGQPIHGSNAGHPLQSRVQHGELRIERTTMKHIITISFYGNKQPQVTVPEDLQRSVELKFTDLLQQEFLVIEHNGVEVYRTFKAERCGEVTEWSEHWLATERWTDWENEQLAFDSRDLPAIPDKDWAHYNTLYSDSETKQRVAYAIDQGWITQEGFEDPTRPSHSPSTVPRCS